MPDERLQGRDSLPNPEKDKSNTKELENDNKEQEQAQEKARSIFEIIKLMIAMVFPQLAIQITVFQKLAEYINDYVQELSKEAAEREEKEPSVDNKEHKEEAKETMDHPEKTDEAKSSDKETLKESGNIEKENKDPTTKGPVKDAPQTVTLGNGNDQTKKGVSLAQKQPAVPQKQTVNNKSQSMDDSEEKKNPVKSIAKGVAKGAAKGAANKAIGEFDKVTRESQNRAIEQSGHDI